jgi:hypothetical protein
MRILQIRKNEDKDAMLHDLLERYLFICERLFPPATGADRLPLLESCMGYMSYALAIVTLVIMPY